MMIAVHSIFASIDGEVSPFHQGRLSTFIRLSGCNLNCSYCDTRYAQIGNSISIEEIITTVLTIGIPKVTITGGEPLLQMNRVRELAWRLLQMGIPLHVETNGSFVLPTERRWPVVVDYKLPSSGMEHAMKEDAFRYLQEKDWVKFVIGTKEDFHRALSVLNPPDSIYSIISTKANIAFSPVHGQIEPAQLLQWIMKEAPTAIVKDSVLNIQLHKLLDLKEDTP